MRVALHTGTPATLWQYDPENEWMYLDGLPMGRLVEPNRALIQKLADDLKAEAERYNRELEAKYR